ncbi:hypothetical protein WJX81_007471 [Elliptochloris bilobata]|uniref:Uncharacterized protein n=1 Tax=Elliptochloris bilobata TaxID=381761 RepID=A0AAW1QDF4_9CHLO
MLAVDAALTALATEWRLSGPIMWPWDPTKSTVLLAALADTLPSTPQVAMLVTGVQTASVPAAMRRLLQQAHANVSAVDVTTQLRMGSAADIPGIRAEARHIAASGELQAALRRRGLAAIGRVRTK